MGISPDRKKELDNLFNALQITSSGRYVYLSDLRENYCRWSKQAVDFFGLPGEYFENLGEIWIEHVHPADREKYLKNIDDLAKGIIDRHEVQYRARAADGSYVVCTCQGTIIRDANDMPMYFGGAIQNHGAINYVDVLTGLRSLYGFFEDLNGLLWQKQKAAVMLTGLSGFSDINTLYGYAFGNSVLRAVGQWLCDECEKVYRLDGTKFAVIMEDTEPETLTRVYTMLQQKCAEGFVVDNVRVNPSVNGGILMLDGSDTTTETVYSCLTYVYSESKKKRHGQAVVFNNMLTDENRRFMKKLNYIRGCITEDCKGFYLCYQPIVDSKTEKLKGVEALLRWKNEEYGVVPPNQFIPVLEQDALFPVLGKWILKTAMSEGCRILEAHPDFIMHVNLAYSQLEQNTFVTDVLRALDETGFPAKNLCLEITERCRILDISMLKNRAVALRSQGIKLALDDFGTGFSSMGLLRELPVDTIKVDREYVKDVTTSVTDQSTIRSITRIADAFLVEICAEGIENFEMVDFLRKCHVTSLQGYLYGKPIPIDDFLREHPTEDLPAESAPESAS